MSSGWNANWSQDGRNVKATVLDTGGSIAAGSTTSIGFVASYSGPNVLPTVFTLNGTICHTE